MQISQVKQRKPTQVRIQQLRTCLGVLCIEVHLGSDLSYHDCLVTDLSLKNFVLLYHFLFWLLVP